MTGHEHDGHARQREVALRARLASLDPTRAGGPAFAADPTPDQVEELIMATTQQPATSEDRRDRKEGAWWRWTGRNRWLAAAAALVLVAVGATGVLVVRDAQRTISTDHPRTVALTASGGGAATSSCVPFDVRFLRDMPVALAGTVTAVTNKQATLTVDRWYHGTAAQQRAGVVTVSVPDATTSVALDGVEFSEGKQYLVAATHGIVNGCGFSGPAEPELKAAYEQAFGS